MARKPARPLSAATMLLLLVPRIKSITEEMDDCDAKTQLQNCLKELGLW